MGHVRVTAASLAEGRIDKLTVELSGLGARTIDRDTALSWMKDGHSFVPVVDGSEGPALQLVSIEGGDEVVHVVRTDNAMTAEDQLPALPSV